MPQRRALQRLLRIDLRGTAFERDELDRVVALVDAATNVETVSLANCSGVTASAVAALLACEHVRGVMLYNVAELENIRSALGAKNAPGLDKAFWSSPPDDVDDDRGALLIVRSFDARAALVFVVLIAL